MATATPRARKRVSPQAKPAHAIYSHRYHRQQLIDGWNQTALTNAQVAIVGSGPLAQYAAAALTALGIGRLRIYDDAPRAESENDVLTRLAPHSESKEHNGNPTRVHALEAILRAINPEVLTLGIETTCTYHPLTILLGEPTVLIDASNDPRSKESMEAYARKHRIPLILASANSHAGQGYIVRPRQPFQKEALLGAYAGQQQGIIPSCIMGGMIAQETRKIIMPLGEEDAPVPQFSYDLSSPTRSLPQPSPALGDSQYPVHPGQGGLREKHALMIGAGALGNFVALGLSMLDIGKLTIVDFDKVEATNLNRQILFYDAVGREKPVALAEKVHELNRNVDVNGLVDKLGASFGPHIQRLKPDIIVDCVDNLATRAFTNYYALKNRVPVVSGGTDQDSGQVVAYVQEKSACLNCKLNVDRALAKQRASRSCLHAPTPSVVLTNEVVGGMMVGEIAAVLAPEVYGEPVRKTLRYDAQSPRRLGLIGIEQPCACARPSMKAWLKDIEKYVEKTKKKERITNRASQ